MGSAKLPTRLLPACPKPSAYFSLYSLSHVRLLQPHGLWPARLLCPWDSPGKNIGVGCRFLLQGIFPTQEPNPGLLHCRVFTDCDMREALQHLDVLPTPEHDSSTFRTQSEFHFLASQQPNHSLPPLGILGCSFHSSRVLAHPLSSPSHINNTPL